MSRKSKREIDAALDGLEPPGEHPEAGLIRIVSSATAGEFELVDPETDLVRCSGDVYRMSPNAKDKLGWPV